MGGDVDDFHGAVEGPPDPESRYPSRHRPGMSESFLRERLFRLLHHQDPRLGFGLFQCRSIVKATGSSPGGEQSRVGTVFRIILQSGGIVPAAAVEVPVGAESGGSA